jgi:hypothetical protein
MTTCRKTLFGRYFSTSASLPSKGWAEKEERCGHCVRPLLPLICQLLLASTEREAEANHWAVCL